MASFRALTLQAGVFTQQKPADTLLVGAGVDADSAGTLSIGAAIATVVSIAAAGITTQMQGPVELFDNSLVWAASVAAPMLFQIQSTTGAGVALTVKSQAALTGSGANGGDIDLLLGNGAAGASTGSINFQTSQGSFLTLAPALQPGTGTTNFILIGSQGANRAQLHFHYSSPAGTGQPGGDTTIEAQKGDGLTTKGGDIYLATGNPGGGTGAFGQVFVQSGGSTKVVTLGTLGPPFTAPFDGNQGGIWLGAAAVTPSNLNFALASDSTNATYLNSSTALYLSGNAPLKTFVILGTALYGNTDVGVSIGQAANRISEVWSQGGMTGGTSTVGAGATMTVQAETAFAGSPGGFAGGVLDLFGGPGSAGVTSNTAGGLGGGVNVTGAIGGAGAGPTGAGGNGGPIVITSGSGGNGASGAAAPGLGGNVGVVLGVRSVIGHATTYTSQSFFYVQTSGGPNLMQLGARQDDFIWLNEGGLLGGLQLQPFQILWDAAVVGAQITQVNSTTGAGNGLTVVAQGGLLGPNAGGGLFLRGGAGGFGSASAGGDGGSVNVLAANGNAGVGVSQNGGNGGAVAITSGTGGNFSGGVGFGGAGGNVSVVLGAHGTSGHPINSNSFAIFSVTSNDVGAALMQLSGDVADFVWLNEAGVSGGFKLTPHAATWDAAVATPTITQVTNTAGAGVAMSITAQAAFAGGGPLAGGNLDLSGGAGGGGGAQGQVVVSGTLNAPVHDAPAALTIGATTATSVSIARVGITTIIVGTLLQIGGAAGPQWKDNGGNLDARNSTDSAYVNVRGADPVAANDFVTLEYASGHYNNVGSAVITFGAGVGSDLATPTVITGQTGITAGSKCEVWIDATSSTADHSVDEHIMGAALIGFSCSAIVPGTGFTIDACSLNGPISGQFNVIWRWS